MVNNQNFDKFNRLMFKYRMIDTERVVILRGIKWVVEMQKFNGLPQYIVSKLITSGPNKGMVQAQGFARKESGYTVFGFGALPKEITNKLISADTCIYKYLQTQHQMQVQTQGR